MQDLIALLSESGRTLIKIMVYMTLMLSKIDINMIAYLFLVIIVLSKIGSLLIANFNRQKLMANKEIRHKTNPFLTDMIIPVRDKKVQLSRLGKDDNVLINQKTGEVQGTHVTTYKRVDSDQFVKLFTANIALTFDLNSAGIKAFSVLMWAIQHTSLGKDVVMLNKITLEDFLIEHEGTVKLSLATFWRGLANLTKTKIIAKHVNQGCYFINPNFVFNGDRIAFTTMIENTGKPPKKVTEEQTEMFD